jgi:aminoglycoside phosphotransferase (APT) family kinase protein
MRRSWERDRAEIALDPAAVATLLDPVFPGAAIAGVERVPGGLVNTNLKILLRGRSDPVLLRIYQRDADAGLKEAGLIRRLAARVPVPALFYAGESNPLTGHAYAILGWVEGRGLDALALAGADLRSAGRALGTALAHVHAVKFDRFGFLGADLKIARPIDLDRDGLLSYLEQAFAADPGAARLGPELTSALVGFVEREGDRISPWPGAPCLVHGDCNGSNLLFRRGRGASGDWELAAMLDWEFAFSGTPGFDFAHFLRPPLVRQPDFADAVAAGYRDAGGALPPDWRAIARVTDLFAWIDIASRPDAGANVIEDARTFIRAIVAGRTPDDS